jgi:RimJ/RimL family protein N-acetyltransferase
MFAYSVGYGKLLYMGDGELKTDRLRLVRLCTDHTEMMHALSVDPEVRRYLWEGQLISLDEVAEIIQASDRCFSAIGTGFYALILEIPDDPNHGAFVGFCGHRLFEGQDDVELRFGLHPQFWGRGFGHEAAITVLSQGFGECGVARVVACTDTPNQRSVRVLQRLGMSFVERRQWHGLDTVFYELTADDFQQL